VKKVLVLGAGMVSRPLVHYLLDRPELEVTVADVEGERATASVAGSARGKGLALDVRDRAAVSGLVGACDLVVSLLPPDLHVSVAKQALEAKRHFLTTSYISDEMRTLDGAVREAGLTFLNEVGLDPGIDHMSALRIIHGIEGRGGTVTSFHSYCGALPAPEADTNPWGYKFSWSPRGVIIAGRNSARYLEDGEEKLLPGEKLFSRHWLVEVKGFGEFEAYYNRDSIPYVQAYGLTGARGMFRATLRYPGWSYTMQKLADLGYFDLQDLTPSPTTYAGLAAALAQVSEGADLAARVADALDVDRTSDTITRMEWLGLFADEPVPWDDLPTRSPLDALASRMLPMMPLEKGERDLCVMQHEIVGEYASGTRETIVSTLVAFGEPDGDSAIARTVGLPAAIAATMVLDGRIADRGVLVPVLPSIYMPVLDELAASAGVVFKERTSVV
jgi:saccharopine dehydrogenase (NADP+, L-glutamate forming)/spermidine synthase